MMWFRRKPKTHNKTDLICAKCGEKISAGINEQGHTYHLNCRPKFPT